MNFINHFVNKKLLFILIISLILTACDREKNEYISEENNLYLFSESEDHPNSDNIVEEYFPRILLNEYTLFDNYYEYFPETLLYEYTPYFKHVGWNYTEKYTPAEETEQYDYLIDIDI